MSSISSYDFLSILQVSEPSADESSSLSFNYQEVLERVRATIAERHSAELANAINNEESAAVLKGLILKYCTEELAGRSFDRDSLVSRIYQDMAGTGVLSPFIYDPNVEEININSFDTIEIQFSDHIKYLCGAEAFPSPQAALDIVKRMIRMGGMILDMQTPVVDSFIGSGTRITASIPPIVPEEVGVTASIRKQNKSEITRKQLIESGSASADMLDFLVLCLSNGVSVGLAGGTGSGKTTDEAFLLNEYIRTNDSFNSRIVIIEDSREIFLHPHTEDGSPARVLYLNTREQPAPVTMLDLIVSSLRYHPALIVPAEVRDAAAYEAAIAGQTGHVILTSFHADNAYDAYQRLVSMCRLARTGLSDETLLDMCVRSWPIMIYKKHLKDRSRKYMEIFEATGSKGGRVQGQMLYQFVIDDTQRDEQGHITKVIGRHRRVGSISPALYKRLRDNGVEDKRICRLFPDLKAEVLGQ